MLMKILSIEDSVLNIIWKYYMYVIDKEMVFFEVKSKK